MSKAILVMDMPNSCNVCEFVKESRACDGDLFCNNPLSQQYGHCVTDYILCRAEGCPLRDLPHKKDREIVQEDYNGGYSHGIVHGYNSCIDEILKV